MSIKDLVTGLENRVDGLFAHAEPVDPVALRDPVLASIGRAEDQWAARSSGHQGDWFSEDNGSVAFSPVLANGAPLTIDGLTTNFIPADRFAGYLVNMRRAVEAGQFDAEIAGATGGSPNVSGVATVAMPEQHDEADRRGGRTADRAGDGSDVRPSDRID